MAKLNYMYKQKSKINVHVSCQPTKYKLMTDHTLKPGPCLTKLKKT